MHIWKCCLKDLAFFSFTVTFCVSPPYRPFDPSDCSRSASFTKHAESRLCDSCHFRYGGGYDRGKTDINPFVAAWQERDNQRSTKLAYDMSGHDKYYGVKQGKGQRGVGRVLF